jgi:hypothetical protein
VRPILPLGLLAASVAGWIVTWDDLSQPGIAILGGWRERWFLLNALFSYAVLWVAIASWLRPNRKVLVAVLTVHIALAIPLVAAEIAAMAGLIDFRSLRSVQGAFREGGPDLPDSRLRAASVPNINAKGKQLPDLVEILGAQAAPIPYDYATDSYGLRNSRDRKNPAIICLGDSMLAAGLVRTDEIITERLEQALGVSVLNVGEPAYSPQEELIRFETTGVDPSGRLIVHFLFEGNDLADTNEWQQWQGAADAVSGSDWPDSGLLRFVLHRLHRPKAAAGALRSGIYPGPNGRDVPVWFLYDAQLVAEEMYGWPSLATALTTANREFRATGSHYVLVLIPSKLTVLHPLMTWPEKSVLSDTASSQSPLPNAIAEFARKEGIPFVDLTLALRASAERGAIAYFPADTHLNATGYAVLAEELIPWVREQLAEVPVDGTAISSTVPRSGPGHAKGPFASQ